MIASCPFHAPSKDLFSTKFSKTRCIYVSSPHSDEARMLLMGRDFSPSYFHTRSLLLALTGIMSHHGVRRHVVLNALFSHLSSEIDTTVFMNG